MFSRALMLTGLGAGFTAFAFSALAQPSGDGYGVHPHMWGGGSWGGWGGHGLFAGPLMVLVTIIVIAVIVMVVARLMGCTAHRCGHRRGHGSSALAILEERFAKGEIDKAEFEERRNALRS